MVAKSHDIEQEVFQLADSVANELGVTLVDVVYRGGKSASLQVIIYAPNGVKVDDCEAVSRLLGERLDEEDVIEQAYTLEVSSPGLERRLRRPHEYDLYKGKRIRIVCRQPVEGQGEWRGELAGLRDDQVLLKSSESQVINIPLTMIKRAQLVY